MTSGAIEKQNQLLIANARLTAVNLRAEAVARRAAFGTAALNAGEVKNLTGAPRLVLAAIGANNFDGLTKNARNLLADVESGALESGEAIDIAETLDLKQSGISRKELLQAIIDIETARSSESAADAIGKSLDSGRLDPRIPRNKGPKPKDRTKELQRLEEFGEDAGKRFANVLDQFGDTPPQITKVNKALRDVDDILDDIRRKKPPNLEQLLKDGERAKDVIRDALNRPFDDFVEQQQEALSIQQLLSEGRESEAEAQRIIFDLERQMGPLREDQKQDVLDTVEALRLQARETEILRQKQQVYLGAVQDARTTIEDTVRSLARGDFGAAGGNLLSGFQRLFEDMLARSLTEQLFGDAFRKIEDQITGVDKVDRAANTLVSSFERLGRAADQAAGAISGAPEGMDGPDIVVKGGDPITPANLLSRLFTTMARGIGISDEAAKKIGVFTSKGLEGAVYGQMAGSLLGGSGSRTGSALGGAIGNALGDVFGKENGPLSKGLNKIFSGLGDFAGPLGSIAGGLLGGLIGGALKTVPRASATIGGSGGSLQVAAVTGTSKALRDQATSSADSAIATLQQIADQFGVGIDASRGSVSIGSRNGKFRVDTSGRGITKTKKGAIDFGEDGSAAIQAATLDLIRDGVLVGLRRGSQALLQNAKDLQVGLQKALKFESVFTRLKEIEDPVGAALDAVDKEFSNLRRTFEEAGSSAAEYAQLEKLYGLQRVDAIKQAGQAMTATLKDLVDELKTGDNGLSLRDRLSAAIATYDPLRDQLRAGTLKDFDAYAQAARTVLDIERQLGGSQDSYFARFNEVTSDSKLALDRQQALIDAAAGRPPALGGSNDNAAPVVSAIDKMSSDLVAAIAGQVGGKLDAVNANLGLILAGGSGGGGGRGFEFRYANNF